MPKVRLRVHACQAPALATLLGTRVPTATAPESLGRPHEHQAQETKG